MKISSQEVRLEPTINLNEAQANLRLQEGNLERMQRELREEVQSSVIEPEKQQRTNSEEIQKLVEEIRKKFDLLSKYLRIEIDQDLEIPVAKIMEKETNRVIRQIPPDYLLSLMKKIDQMLGILLEKEA